MPCAPCTAPAAAWDGWRPSAPRGYGSWRNMSRSVVTCATPFFFAAVWKLPSAHELLFMRHVGRGDRRDRTGARSLVVADHSLAVWVHSCVNSVSHLRRYILAACASRTTPTL